MNKKILVKTLLIMLLPLALLINYLSTLNSYFTEKFYSNGLYKGISWFIGILTGWLPFSLAEVLFILLIFFIVWRVIKLIFNISRHRSKWWLTLGNAAINCLVGISVIYFAFVIMWGLNYNRLSLPDLMDIEVKPSSSNELAEVTGELATLANELRPVMHENEDGVMIPFDGVGTSFLRARKGFKEAALIYPFLNGSHTRPKPVFFSKVMSYTNIWGIYSPFTVEANVNMAIPSPMLLTTMTHEMAHQIGFASEDEANYIAYLTCIMHPDKDFQYAGALFALSYTLNALNKHDRHAYQEISSTLHDGIVRDLAENKKFNEQYDGPVGEVFSKTNDIYLKANNQKDGVKSYGRVVDLLLAEKRQQTSN